jgi:hypothetical protein
MLTSRIRQTSVALVAGLALLGLSACGGSEGSGSDAPATKTKSAPEAEATTAEPTDDAAAPSASGDQPKWAQPATEGGEKISSFKVGDVTVDVFQMGTTKATKTGQFVDPDTNKPVIAEGADIVFVNYVITNTGDPIDLGSSLVDVSARYDDWKYLQGMDSIVDDDLFKAQGVNDDSLAPGAFAEPSVYPFGTGQKYSVGANFLYQANSPITFEATIVPVDAAGELLHDKRVEGKGTGTIK